MIRIRTLLPVAAAPSSPLRLWLSSTRPPPSRTCCKQVANVRTDENQAFQTRRAEYDGTATQAQKDALAAARRADSATRLDTTSKRLSDTYSANELRISNLNTQLRDKATALGLAELFGLARQVANDTSSILQQSLITTQFPPAAGELRARRVVAAVLGRASDADSRRARAPVARDPARDDGERAGREVPDARRAAGR